jgi:outer membrane protein OmpA-like peptidoglycan-associated protein/opacity protein-like surface antigen
LLYYDKKLLIKAIKGGIRVKNPKGSLHSQFSTCETGREARIRKNAAPIFNHDSRREGSADRDFKTQLVKAVWGLGILAGLSFGCLCPVRAMTLQFTGDNCLRNDSLVRTLIPEEPEEPEDPGDPGDPGDTGKVANHKYVSGMDREEDLFGLTLGLLYPAGKFGFGLEVGGADDLRWAEFKVDYLLGNMGRFQVRPALAWLRFNAEDNGGFKLNHGVVGVDLSYQLSRRAALKGSIGYGFALPTVALPVTYDGNTETVDWGPAFWGYRVAFEYQFHQNWLFNLGYRIYQYEGDGIGVKYNYNIERQFNLLTAGLIYRFGAASSDDAAETTPVTLNTAPISPNPAPAKLKLDEITPSEGINNGPVWLELTGSGYAAGMKVILNAQVDRRIEGKVIEVNLEKLICRFDLNGKLPGCYDLAVYGPAGQVGVLSQCFTVREVPDPVVIDPAPVEKPVAPMRDLQELNRRFAPIYFDFDRSVLRQDQVYKLEVCIKLLREDPELLINISGHADARGKKLYNDQLSLQRAETVRRYLVAHGIAPERIEIAAYGSSRPAVNGNGERVWRLNRRVELVVAEERTAKAGL